MRALTPVVAKTVVEPNLSTELLAGDQDAVQQLDRIITSRVLDATTLRVKLWDCEHLMQRAIDASDLERRRITADLHDGAVQDLVGTSFVVTAAAQSAGHYGPELATDLRSASNWHPSKPPVTPISASRATDQPWCE